MRLEFLGQLFDFGLYLHEVKLNDRDVLARLGWGKYVWKRNGFKLAKSPVNFCSVFDALDLIDEE